MISDSTQVAGLTQNQEFDQFVQLLGALNTVSQVTDQRNAAESDKTFVVFADMLKEMKASMQLNREEMHQLRERVAAGEHRNKELELLLQAEKKASAELHQAEKLVSDARIDALNEKITVLSKKLSELEHNFAGHYHLTTTGQVLVGYRMETLTTGPEGVTKGK